MNRDEAVVLARQGMESGASEHEVREQLRRAGYTGSAADGIIQDAYRSRLKLTGRRSTEFERKQLIVFISGGLLLLGAPFVAPPWSMFGGFNIVPFVLGAVGIVLMIGAVKMRPKFK